MMASVHAFGGRGRAAFMALAVLAAPWGAVRAEAQAPLPATACDAVLEKSDLHSVDGMPLEDGTKAFKYVLGGSFVSGGGTALTINVDLTFQPGPDATIRFAALDEACGGSNGSATIFSHTFGDLTSVQNLITFDALSGEVAFNGAPQKTAQIGSARYLFIDVWDGELPSTHAAHSYLIDILSPVSPTAR